jgi:two-component system response regulator RegA
MADLEQNPVTKDKTLFIIEDDKPFRERLTTSFQRKDFTVTAAASKKEALDVLSGNNFNYAIVDLRLGDGSGLDVIKVIKEQNPECRTVMLTSYGNIATAVSSVKLGADDYLTKPANIDDIEKSLMSSTATSLPPPPENPMSADRIRWEHIQRVFTQCNRNVSETARRLKMHRRTLQRILNKHAPKE